MEINGHVYALNLFDRAISLRAKCSYWWKGSPARPSSVTWTTPL